MAETAIVNVLLKARDEASAAVGRLASSLGLLPGSLGRIAGAGGVFGVMAAGAIAAGGAVLALAKDFTEQAIALERISKGTNSTLEEVQVLQQVYQRFGGTSEEATTALEFMSKAISLHHVELAAMGVDSRNAYQAILQLSDVTKKHGDAASINAELSKLLGRQWRSLIGIVTELRDATVTERAEMEKAGAIMDEAGIQKAKQMRDAMEELSVRWRGVWLQLAEGAVGPATTIVKVITVILDVLEKLNKFQALGTGSRSAPELFKYAKERGLSYANIVAEYGAGLGDVQGEAGFRPHAGGPRSLLRPDESEEETPAFKAHKKLVQELTDAYPKWTRAQLESAAALFELDERMKKVNATMAKMSMLQPGGGGLVGPPIPLWAEVAENKASEAGAEQARVDAMNAYAESFRNLNATSSEVFNNILNEWGATTKRMLELGTVLNEAFRSVFAGLQSGVRNAFQGLIAGGQGMASAFKSIISGIGDAILDMMSRVVASQLFWLFIRLLGLIVHIPGVTAPTIGITPMTDFGGGGVLPGSAGPAGGARARGGNTIIIQSFTALDAIQQLASPGAPLRRAFETVGGASSF